MSFDPTYNPYSLVGKTILITGASSGIGRATAIECSKLGATCVITGRNEERLQGTLDQLVGDGHIQIVADLTEDASLNALVERVSQADGVVLCAGIGMTLPILFSTRKHFDKVFETNFFAPVELMRLLGKKKKLKHPSSIVLIDSIGGTGRWSPGNGVYGSSKAALQSIMHYFAVEWGSKNIRVNTINPGMVDTPLIHKGSITEEQMAEDMAKYPLGRYGKPEEIARGVVYLLSDAASWVTGHSLVIDGGITAK